MGVFVILVGLLDQTAELMLRIGASYIRNTNRVGAFEPLDISPISSGRKGA